MTAAVILILIVAAIFVGPLFAWIERRGRATNDEGEE